MLYIGAYENLADYCNFDIHFQWPTMEEITISPNNTGIEDLEATKDASPSEPHGDAGRAQEKADKQIEDLKNQLEGATKKVKNQLKKKIENIARDAAKKKKGETHGRKGKGN